MNKRSKWLGRLVAWGKQVFWSSLAFLIIIYSNCLVTMALHPCAGNEYHEIFAHFSGGRLDIAYRVYIEYAVSASVIVFVMILFRYPAHWFIVLTIGSFVAWGRWFNLCFFPYQGEHFHSVCICLSLVIAPIVSCAGLLARILLWWVCRNRKQKAQTEDEPVI